MNDEEKRHKREKIEKLSDDELYNSLEDSTRELIARHNTREIRKVIKRLALSVYDFPRKKFSLNGKYTVRPYPNQKKMKVLVLICEPDKFEEELERSLKISRNAEHGHHGKPETKKKKKDYVTIKIEGDDDEISTE